MVDFIWQTCGDICGLNLCFSTKNYWDKILILRRGFIIQNQDGAGEFPKIAYSLNIFFSILLWILCLYIFPNSYIFPNVRATFYISNNFQLIWSKNLHFWFCNFAQFYHDCLYSCYAVDPSLVVEATKWNHTCLKRFIWIVKIWSILLACVC